MGDSSFGIGFAGTKSSLSEAALHSGRLAVRLSPKEEEFRGLPVSEVALIDSVGDPRSSAGTLVPPAL